MSNKELSENMEHKKNAYISKETVETLKDDLENLTITVHISMIIFRKD